MWGLAAKGLGFLKNKWVLGTGAALAVGGAVSHEGGLVGLGKDLTGAGAQVTSHAGVEQTGNNFFNMLKLLARIMDAFGIAPGLSNSLKNVGNKGLDNKTEEQKMDELAVTDEGRTSQRKYDLDANNNPLATYTLQDKNENQISPSSVKLSTEPATTSNTVYLGLKGIKDGAGVALGWAGGIVAGAPRAGSCGW